MANQEPLTMLKQGVEVWNRWRQENPDVMIDQRVNALYGRPKDEVKAA